MRKVAFWLSLAVVFMIPWENSIAFASESTPGTQSTLTRFAGLLLAAVWFGAVLVSGRVRKPHVFHLACFLFVMWNAASLFWSFGAEATEQRVKTYLQLAVLTYVLWDLYTTPQALRAGLQAYVLGAYVTIGSTVSNYLAGNAFYDYSLARYTGAGLNANDLALILALGLPVAWHLAISAGDEKGSPILRLANYVYMPAALFAILLSASRMALLCTVPILIYVLGTFSQLKLHTRVVIFIVLVWALFAFQSYLPEASLDRLATFGSSISSGDFGGRTGTWNEALRLLREHPVIGVGGGAFPKAATIARMVAHNTYLSISAELGMIGMGFFGFVLAVCTYEAWRQPRRHSRFWLTVLLVWAIGVLALSWEATKPTWLFLGLVIVSASLYGQREPSTTAWKLPGESSGLSTSPVVWRDVSPG